MKCKLEKIAPLGELRSLIAPRLGNLTHGGKPIKLNARSVLLSRHIHSIALSHKGNHIENRRATLHELDIFIHRFNGLSPVRFLFSL